MRYSQVKSSHLAGIGFEEGEGLTVDFKNGTSYRYPTATAEIYEAIRDAESVGSAFAKLVRLAGLPFVVVK